MKKIPFIALFVLLISGFIFSCATIVEPSGGPKDEMPPKVVRFLPKKNSTSFHQNKIAITFDEFIKIDNINKHLLVSPPMKNKPTFLTSGKSLIIKLSDTLKENTTYRIYMGDAIVDLHENNPIKNFDYTFSTGAYIDSLEIKGKVIDAYTQKPVGDVLVMLYKNSYDSIPLKELPDYISKTDKNGNFVFKNLQNKQFMIFALSDINSNYLFDLQSEDIAYYDSLIYPYYQPLLLPSDSITSDSLKKTKDTVNQKNKPITLSLFKEMDTVFRYEQYTDFNRLLSIGFNQPINDLDVELLQPKTATIQVEKIEKDSVNIWLYGFEKDTALLHVKSNAKNMNDTLLFSYFPSKKDQKKLQKAILNIKLKDAKQSVFYKKPTLVFDRPLDTVNLPEKIQLVTDTDTIDVAYKVEGIRSLSMTYPWKEEAKSYKIYIPDSTFKDMYGLYNKKNVLRLNHTAKAEFGTLIIHINMNETKHKGASYIVQLLEGDKEEVIRTVTVHQDTTIHFDFLKANNYALKAIIDRNNNGKWNGGIYLKKLPPEMVVSFPEKIQIISGWEVEKNWDF